MNVLSCFSPAPGKSGPLKGHAAPAVPASPANETKAPRRMPCPRPERQKRRFARLPEKQACVVPGIPSPLHQKKRINDAGRDYRTLLDDSRADAAVHPPVRSSAPRPFRPLPFTGPLPFLKKKNAVCKTPAVGLFPWKRLPEKSRLLKSRSLSRAVPFLLSAEVGIIRPHLHGRADTKNTSLPLSRLIRGLLKTRHLRYEQLVCSFSVRKKERTGLFRPAKKDGVMTCAAVKGCVILKQYIEIIQYSRGASFPLPPVRNVYAIRRILYGTKRKSLLCCYVSYGKH